MDFLRIPSEIIVAAYTYLFSHRFSVQTQLTGGRMGSRRQLLNLPTLSYSVVDELAEAFRSLAGDRLATVVEYVRWVEGNAVADYGEVLMIDIDNGDVPMFGFEAQAGYPAHHLVGLPAEDGFRR